MKRRQIPLYLALSLFLLPATGCCKQDAPPPNTAEPLAKAEEKQPAPAAEKPPQPATETAGSANPTQSAAPLTTQPAEEEPKKPKRPKDSWVIFREARDENADANIDAKWSGGNKFHIETVNVKRITIDMTKLPEGPPTKGPWIIQIDDQGIELTGFKPRPGYTGHIRDLVRSKNGVWDVDRKRLYRLGG